MTFTFEESVKTILALQAKFNAVKYDDPQVATLRLAYVAALEEEFAICHKLCTETREDYTKRTAQEVLEGLKKKR